MLFQPSIVPVALLPKIALTGSVIGYLSRADFRVHAGVRVFASLGDLQSTMYPLLMADPSGYPD